MRALAYLCSFFAAACSAQPAAPDYAREKRWAQQVEAALVVGEPRMLRAASGPAFLGLHALPTGRARGAVLLAHGPGLHPDHGVTGELRVALADRGFETLSLQLPVLAADVDDGAAYQALFPEAAQRIATGVRYLQDRGHARVAIVSHAMGSGMTYEYLRRNRDAPVAAWAALSFYGVFRDIAGAAYPVLDLYGAADYRGIRGPAAERRRVLDTVPGSRQRALPEGGRFLAGGEKAVLAEVARFLDESVR